MPLRQVFLLIVAFGLGLLGCSPTYNWREVKPEGAGLSLQFPGKPDRMSRNIDLNGNKLSMQMTGAKAGEQAFTLAWVDTASPDLAKKAAQDMQLGMLRNLGLATDAATIKRQSTFVLSKDGSSKELASQVSAKGNQTMQALFFSKGNRAWQAVTVAAKLDEEAAKIYLESVRFVD